MSLSAKTYTIHLEPCSFNPTAMCTNVSISGYQMKDVFIDTGATTSQLTYKDFIELRKRGVLSSSNFLCESTARDANGTERKTQRYRIESLNIDGVLVQNLVVIFTSKDCPNAKRLLGLNFFKFFRFFMVDFEDNILMLIK